MGIISSKVTRYRGNIRKVFLDYEKYHYNKEYVLEDSINHFLIYSNNWKHNTTGFAPFQVMINVNDESLNSKSNLRLKSLNWNKENSWELWERPACKDFQ